MEEKREISLKVEDIHKLYGSEARPVSVLRGISFEMSEGHNLAITGPSGSGKSTLLHILGTLDHPTSGKIELNGQEPFVLPEPELARFRNQVIGFVFQDHYLLPQYSVLDNVLIPALAFASDNGEIKRRALELLEKVGLSDRLDYLPSELSNDEKQRVALARAFINQPWLLLCDEPTGNLDPATGDSMASLLFDLHKEEQNILIVVTHNLNLAARFERQFELKEGTCVEV